MHPSPSSWIRTVARERSPARYAVGNVSFAAPEPEQVDNVVLVLRDPRTPGAPFVSAAVTREALSSPRDTLHAFASRKLVALVREAPDIELLGTEHAQIAGRAAMRLQFRWGSPAGAMEQIMVLIDAADDPERKITLFNVTAPAALAHESARVLDALLESVAFADAAPDEPTAALPSAPAPELPVYAHPPADLVPMPGYAVRR